MGLLARGPVPHKPRGRRRHPHRHTRARGARLPRAAAPARRLRPPSRHRVRCARARRRQALAARVRRACVGFSNAGSPCAGTACVGEPEAIK
ncbi:hypothetical protein C1851_02460 [Eggerthella lenta]|nr:hypothetical protein C1851_02460 [Eggerthella lenta]